MKLILQIVCAIVCSGIILLFGWSFYNDKEIYCKELISTKYGYEYAKYTRFNWIVGGCESKLDGIDGKWYDEFSISANAAEASFAQTLRLHRERQDRIKRESQ